MQLSHKLQERLRCPVCRQPLQLGDMYFTCTAEQCGAVFPVRNGIPILLNEQQSIFDCGIADTPVEPPQCVELRHWLNQVQPTPDLNLFAPQNYAHMSHLLLELSPEPQVLVIGGGIFGYGMDQLLAHQTIQLVESDVYVGPRTMLVCDGHDIPFADGSFEGIIFQAVLEHVADPYRCVAEAHRVLRPNGIVYAETPFMQQVHMGRYDFTRFTHLGHRRLFRAFDEVASGVLCGPGMALAWAYEYFLLSFTTSRLLRKIIRRFAHFTSFYLKYFDYYLAHSPGAIDAASGFYFLGRRSEQVLSDRELIRLYRGAVEV